MQIILWSKRRSASGKRAICRHGLERCPVRHRVVDGRCADGHPGNSGSLGFEGFTRELGPPRRSLLSTILLIAMGESEARGESN